MDGPPGAPPPAPPPSPPTKRLQQRLDTHLIIPVFRVGFPIGGSGEMEYECDESGTNVGACPDSFPNIDYEDETGLMLGADLLFRVGSGLRLGAGTLIALDPKYKLEALGNSQTLESGFEASLFGVIEGVFPVGDTVGLTLRGQLGVTALFAGEDHEDALDDFKSECQASSADTCDLNEGPFFGPHVGLGFGVLIDVGSVAFRAELLGQAVRYPLWDSKVSSAGTTLEIKQDIVGTRSLLMLGLEL